MYNVKIIEYEASGEREVHLYSFPMGAYQSDEIKAVGGSNGVIDKDRSKTSSFNRTKNKVYDYSRANHWHYFLTFTFDPNEVNRYSFEETSKKMSKWFNNMRQRKARNLKYLAVPEQHKDGAWHFHALVANVGNISFIDSGKKTKKGQVIYNCDSYKFGWTTATEITDSVKAANYITKYITKEMCSDPNRKRYWTSRNVDKGSVSSMLLDDKQMEDMRSSLSHSSKWSKKIIVNKDDYYLEKNIYTLVLN